MYRPPFIQAMLAFFYGLMVLALIILVISNPMAIVRWLQGFGLLVVALTTFSLAIAAISILLNRIFESVERGFKRRPRNCQKGEPSRTSSEDGYAD